MLYTFLKERMREYPDRVLRDANGEITYRELLCDSQRCAKDLRDRKYGIYCKSEINTVRALFACLCAQKTAVMMSPRYGPIHNEKIIRQMEISVLITDDGIHRLTRPTAESEDLSDVALILSTSGTTGAPKGAMITHQNLITNLCDIERYFTIDAQDRIMITRPLYHCAVLTGELLISLCKGLNIFFWNVEFNPQAILKQLCLEKATVFCATPTLLYYLSRFAARQGLCPPLKTIAVSGECMTAKTAGQIIRFAPNAKIHHVYGLTEASPRVSALPPELFGDYPMSVGFPLRSIQAKVDGGELLIRGNSIMKGYYKAPDATRRVLRNGWLHTGDMADIDETGRITIRSRKDDMIIRAGMNVYPAEIENALKMDDRIKEALVYGVADQTTQKIHCKLVADGLSKSELQILCRQVLAPYQFPDHVEFVDSLPRNASGKVIRKGAYERDGI